MGDVFFNLATAIEMLYQCVDTIICIFSLLSVVVVVLFFSLRNLFLFVSESTEKVNILSFSGSIGHS